jgi:hypothetical protein
MPDDMGYSSPDLTEKWVRYHRYDGYVGRLPDGKPDPQMMDVDEDGHVLVTGFTDKHVMAHCVVPPTVRILVLPGTSRYDVLTLLVKLVDGIFNERPYDPTTDDPRNVPLTPKNG